MNYPLGDFLIRLKNAKMAGNYEVNCRSTKLIAAVSKALQKEGYLDDVTVSKGVITVKLAKSHKNPVLMNIKLISKPGVRVYKSVKELQERKARSSVIFLSTPNGILSDRLAIKENSGGEAIMEVW